MVRGRVCGRQACVYDPPVACAAGSPSLDVTAVVGKVHGRVRDREHELAALRVAARANAAGDFTARLLGTCQTRDGRVQVLLSRAEATLEADVNAVRTPEQAARIYTRLVPLARGLARLARAGYAHHDIGPRNVMRRHGRYILVDFGNALPLADVFTPRNPYLRASWPYNPPEYKLSVGLPPASAAKNYRGWPGIDVSTLPSMRWDASMAVLAAPKTDAFAFGVLLLWVAGKLGGRIHPLPPFLDVGRAMAVMDPASRPTLDEGAALMAAAPGAPKTASGVSKRMPTARANAASQSEKSPGRPAASPT